MSAHLTVGQDGPGNPDAPSAQRLAPRDDGVYSQTAWPQDRDCGLVLGDRCAATFGFGPHRGWHGGLPAGRESHFQPIRSARADDVWHPNLELPGTDGVLFLGGTSDHVDVYLHRGPWTPPGRPERLDAPEWEVAPGPYQAAGRAAPFHTATVEELTAAIEGRRAHRSAGRDGRWALDMIMGIYESHRRGGARVELPLPHRDHPLERWLRSADRLPPKPAPRQRALRVAGGGAGAGESEGPRGA